MEAVDGTLVPGWGKVVLMNGHAFFSCSSPGHRPRKRAFTRGFGPAAAFTLLALAGSGPAGCAKSEVVGPDLSHGGAGGGGGAVGGQVSLGSGGTIQLTIDTTPTVTPSNEDAGGTSQVVGCDGGDGCVCPPLSVAVVGTPGVWGDGNDKAFQNWLNSSSAGTAKVDVYTVKPAFTSDFLAGYNVIILAGLGDNSNTGPWWAFSASEIAAFQDWVENGGGVISLSGYSNDNNEIVAKNALLAFSGISYTQDCISPACSIVDANNNKMCYRCGNPYQITEWNRSDPVIANLSLGVTMIGLDGARPIKAPADAHVAATTTASSVSNWLVAKVTGKGRVLVYADEWITYTDQWNGQDAQYANDPSCKGFLPETLYQTAQFWYDMIRWVQPNDNCFKIVNTPQQPILVW